MKLEIYRGRGKQPWRWRLRYMGGERAAISEEGFPTDRAVAKAFWRFINGMVAYRQIVFRNELLWFRRLPHEREFVTELLRMLRKPTPARNRGPRGRKGRSDAD